MTTCPSCHVAVQDTEQFCEACGAELSPAVAAGGPASAEQPAGQPTEQPAEAPVAADDLAGTEATCRSCGGAVAADGYCGTCGARATKRRDHFSEQPATWVAAVCDRGLRHARNEDAVAVAAGAEPGSSAVLVVCDGVSSSTDSDLASLAAARAAREVLTSSRPRGMGAGLSLIAAVIARIEAAADAASDAVIGVSRGAGAVAAADLGTGTADAGAGDATAGDTTAGGTTAGGTTAGGTTAGGTTAGDITAGGRRPVLNPASCTFVAAVLEQDLLVVGSVGDSRAYWLPDVGAATILTMDDSFAQVQMAAGVPRAEAESGPQSHAIMRWLGADAPDHKPTTATMTLAAPGWLLLCSDGLWNYCSEAQDLADLVARVSLPGSTSPAAAEPLTLAAALVDWAKTQGGQDNISVALARIQPG